MTDDELEAYWDHLEAIGRHSGHVVCRCPRCGQCQMISYRPLSRPWPICRVCAPGSLTAGVILTGPRVVPVGDPSLVRKRPGRPRTDRQLAADGAIRRPPDRTVGQTAWEMIRHPLDLF